MKRVTLLLACAGLPFLLGGCIRQTLTVTSDPAGAKVYFDGHEKGTTPVEFKYKWQGRHRITLRTEDDQWHRFEEQFRSPWYLIFPLDFFCEIAPYPIRHRQYRHYSVRTGA